MRRALLLLVACCTVRAAEPRAAIEAYVAAHKPQIFSELVALLSIPNVAADRDNIRRNADLLKTMLERRGLAAQILETEGNPLVYGEHKAAGAARTVLFYAHYDGQPVDASRWKQRSPFQPLLRDGRMEDGARQIPDLAGLQTFGDDWRLCARSASDDKSPIVALLTALDALKAAGRAATSNLRVILDGEEEAGSPSLTRAIGRYRDKLAADVALILDGPLHSSGRPTLTFGARGVVSLELTVYGPKFALHSGHYGNWVPNPAIRLAQLLASMKDDQGRVLIAGFYDGIPPLSAADRAILRAVPDDEKSLQKLFGVARPEAVGESLQEALQFPSLNVRGLRSGYVGAEARTIIPAEATAAIDIRLVKETPGDQMVSKLLAHIRQQGYRVVDQEPDDATRLAHPKLIRVTRRRGDDEAYRTAMDLPESLAVAQALDRMWGAPPVRLRTSGGTVPLSQFIRALGFPAIGVPTVNFDNNQHSENENLRLGHFWNAIVTMSALLTQAPVSRPAASDPAGAYGAAVEQWRQHREAELKADDGWLTVAGLFWLKEGANRCGADPSNDIVLPAGSAPARVGVFEFHQGKTLFRAQSGVAVTLHGKPVTTLELRSDSPGPPDVIAVRDLTLHVIKRNNRYALRLRDKNSRMRKAFPGLRWFPVRESYRITARFVPYDSPKVLAIPTILGDFDKLPSPGYAAFILNGKEYRLDPVIEEGESDLFFIFRDLTSGKETYPAGRFLHAAMPRDGKVILDFNEAYNPPCAFTAYATCPLPPPQNRLPVRIEAGELSYHEKGVTP